MLGGVGAGGQLALDGSLGQHARVRDHGLHRRLHGAQRLGQFADFVVLVQRQRVAEITGGHFIGVLHELVGGGGDAAGDQPAQCGTQRCGQHRQYQQQAFCVTSQLFCCLAPCLDQGSLAFYQGLNGSDVAGLAVAQGARQHAGGFFALACLDQADVFPHVLHINRPDILDLLQAGFASVCGDHLLQFGNAFRDDAALFWQTIEFFLGFSLFENVEVAQHPRIHIDGIHNVVGHYRFGEILLHQRPDIAVDLVDPGHANAGHNDQQDQCGAEADGQPDSNLHVLEHIDLFLKNWLNSVLPGSLKWFRPMPGFRPFCCLQSLGPPVVSRRVRPESGRLRRCPEW